MLCLGDRLLLASTDCSRWSCALDCGGERNWIVAMPCVCGSSNFLASSTHTALTSSLAEGP
eukprot:12914651-Prorocentrum_lima.AAC.1